VGQGVGRFARADRACPVNGFSLTELIGVLAIVAILLGVLVRAWCGAWIEPAWTKEVYDMAAISNAMTLRILRDYAISDTAGWALR
jgi:prepilin-type N-terminal cleavage/methylation domain-containing protein